MRPSLFYRIAALVSLLFAIGHTAGFLSFRPTSAEGQAAVKAMAVMFSEDGTRFSYAGFYQGFGLSCTLAMLLVAAWSWWLGGLAKSAPRIAVVPGIALTVYQIGGLVLAALYFPVPAVVFSAVLPILCGIAVVGALRAN